MQKRDCTFKWKTQAQERVQYLPPFQLNVGTAFKLGPYYFILYRVLLGSLSMYVARHCVSRDSFVRDVPLFILCVCRAPRPPRLQAPSIRLMEQPSARDAFRQTTREWPGPSLRHSRNTLPRFLTGFPLHCTNFPRCLLSLPFLIIHLLCHRDVKERQQLNENVRYMGATHLGLPCYSLGLSAARRGFCFVRCCAVFTNPIQISFSLSTPLSELTPSAKVLFQAGSAPL